MNPVFAFFRCRLLSVSHIAGMIFIFSACASKGPSASGLQLQTRITEGGLKLFELVFPAPAETLRLPSGSSRQREKSPEMTSRQMEALLDDVMDESRYCREGYVLLGRYAGETTRRLRGECRERATEDDRRQFPDTVDRW